MNHLKQLSLVVAILFLSLLTSVGLSYVITPGAQATTVTQKAETNPPKKRKSVPISNSTMTPEVIA